jgi:Ni,Fe-hydrogenase I cytochrome b subunit
LAMAASLIVFGYLIPVQLLTAIDNGMWTHAIPRLALRTVPVLLGAVIIFALVGAALILASTSGGKRRQFSTPLSVTRYRGGDNPGWS